MGIALEFQRAEKLAGAGLLTEAQARDVLDGILKRSGTGEALRGFSIEKWFKEWFDGKEARRSDATGARYGQIVKEFLEHLGSRAKRPLNALITRDVQGFLSKRSKAGCSPTTVQLDGKIIRAALNQARKEGLVSVNVADAAELPERQSVERGTFTAAEVKMLVDAAEPEWKTLILLGYYTGARLGDCCNMPWDAVDLTAGTLTYRQAKAGKSAKAVTVPLHPDLSAHLEKLASSDKAETFISPHMAGLKPGGRHGLSEGFKRIVTKAGLSLDTVQGGGTRKISKRTFHALRHSFNSALANAGVSQELRMKLTGHKTAAINTGYTHHELETLRGAVAKLPTLGGEVKR